MTSVLKILSSMAPREVLAAAGVLYGEHNAIRIEARAAGGVEVARRVSDGEVIDVVVLAGEAIDRLIRDGKLLAESRLDLMTCGIGIAVRAGAAHPGVGDEVAVKSAVLSAASVSYSTGPSGTYLEKLFDRWGILPTIRDRIAVAPPGIPVARLIAAGDAALGFQQLSELIDAPQVDVIGAMPAEIQHVTTFAGGISPACEHREAAENFLRFMASAEVETLGQRHGMMPVQSA